MTDHLAAVRGAVAFLRRVGVVLPPDGWDDLFQELYLVARAADPPTPRGHAVSKLVLAAKRVIGGIRRRTGKRHRSKYHRHTVLFSELGREYVTGRAAVFARDDERLAGAGEYAERAATVAELLAVLTQRQREVVRMKFGIGRDRPEPNNAKIAAAIGVTKQAVLECESLAAARCRAAADGWSADKRATA